MNGASGIGWDENSPADTESAGLGDDRMRSIKTSVRQGLDDEHNWPSAGGNGIGYHRYGSARPFWNAQSLVSSSGTEGRIMVTSDTSRFFGVGSGGTLLLGAGPMSLSVGSMAPITFPQRHYIAEELGQGVTGSGGSALITFPNSGFSGVPFTFAQGVSTVVGTNAFMQVTPVDGQTVVVSALASGVFLSNMTFYWRSIGTRVL